MGKEGEQRGKERIWNKRANRRERGERGREWGERSWKKGEAGKSTRYRKIRTLQRSTAITGKSWTGPASRGSDKKACHEGETPEPVRVSLNLA